MERSLKDVVDVICRRSVRARDTVEQMRWPPAEHVVEHMSSVPLSPIEEQRVREQWTVERPGRADRECRRAGTRRQHDAVSARGSDPVELNLIRIPKRPA